MGAGHGAMTARGLAEKSLKFEIHDPHKKYRSQNTMQEKSLKNLDLYNYILKSR